MNRWPSRAGRKAPINRTHSKRFALANESADHAVAFGVRASSAPLSQGWLQFDGRPGSWKAPIRFCARVGTMNPCVGRHLFGVPPSGGPNRLKPGLRTVGSWKASSACLSGSPLSDRPVCTTIHESFRDLLYTFRQIARHRSSQRGAPKLWEPMARANYAEAIGIPVMNCYPKKTFIFAKILRRQEIEQSTSNIQHPTRRDTIGSLRVGCWMFGVGCFAAVWLRHCRAEYRPVQ